MATCCPARSTFWSGLPASGRISRANGPEPSLYPEVLPSPTPSFVSSRGTLQKIAARGVTALSLNLGGDAGAAQAIWSIGTDINITDVLVFRDATWAPANLATDGERVFFTDVVAKRVGLARVVAASSDNPRDRAGHRSILTVRIDSTFVGLAVKGAK